MKTLLRFSLAIACVLMMGVISLWLVAAQHVDVAFADQPSQQAAPQLASARPPIPVATGEAQILLRTTILDIDRQKMAQLGIDFNTSQATPPRTLAGKSSKQVSIVNDREAALFAKAITASGAAKILAEPTIVANDGRRARFHSGGEFPLIVPQDKNTVSIEYREFGTSIDFLPKKLADGKLRLEIRVGQTDFDPSRNVEVNGNTIPGLKSQQIDTAIELKMGQSAMLRHGRLLVIVTPEFVAPQVQIGEQPQPPHHVREFEFKEGMRLSTLLGQTVTVNFTHKIPELQVGDESVVEVQASSPNQVRMTAKKAGKTKLTVSNEDGETQEIEITVVGKTLPSPPRPTPLREPLAGPAQITMTALIYSFNAQQLAGAGVDIRKMISPASSPAEPSAAPPKGEPAKAIVAVISPRAAATLTARLEALKGIQVLSRPQVRTIDGQSARVQVGSRVLLATPEKVQQVSGEFQDIGVSLELVPIVKGDRVHLQAQAEHSRLSEETNESTGRSRVESVRLFGTGDLYPGEALVVCQHDDEDEQLLVFVTPMITRRELKTPSPSKREPTRTSLQAVHAEQAAAEATLNALATHYGANHPQRLQQAKRLDSLRQQAQVNGAGVADAPHKQPLQDLGEMIQELFPDAKIRLHPLPSGILMRGTVSKTQDANVLAGIAETYFPNVLNDLSVQQQHVDEAAAAKADPDDLRVALDELFPTADIKIYPLHSGIVLSGRVAPASALRIAQVAEEFYPKVISHLTEVHPSQPAQRNPSRHNIDSATPDHQASPSLHDELQDLRQDVKHLRRDVSSLLELLREPARETELPKTPSLDAQSTTPPKDDGSMMWKVIGIRAAPTELDTGRYRGGLKISEVRPDSPAAKEDIRKGDVLVGFDKWETITATNVAFALDSAQEANADRLKFYVLRGDETLFGHLKLSRPLKNTIKSGDASDRSLDQVASSQIPDPSVPLKPNDRLTIESPTDKTLNRDVTILSDGTITLPLLGQVAAAGRSLVEQREELESLYQQYYREPQLTLSFYGTCTPANSMGGEQDAATFTQTGPPDPNADLKPGDRLLLESLTAPEISRHLTVLADGTVTVPLLGQIPAAGRTLTTLNEELTGAFKKFLKQPQLTVSFLGTSSPAR